MVRQLLRRSILLMGVLGVALPASPVFGQQGAQNGEWRSYGGDAGSTKYSSLDLIDETNVQDLEVVWRWQTVDYERQAEDPDLRVNNLLLATPLKVGDALFTTPWLRGLLQVEGGAHAVLRIGRTGPTTGSSS